MIDDLTTSEQVNEGEKEFFRALRQRIATWPHVRTRDPSPAGAAAARQNSRGRPVDRIREL